MATNVPPHDENPATTGVEPVYFFEGTAVVPPDGTPAPPRPAGAERRPAPPGTTPGWEYVELEGSVSVPAQGTPAPSGRERRVPQPAPAAAAEIDVLVVRIETALQTIHDALARIKRLQGKAG